MNADVELAVDCLRQATVLIDSYLILARKLSKNTLLSGTRFDPGLWDLEDRLRSMDQQYAGAWEKLDEARQMLDGAGYDVSNYDAVRSRVHNNALGFEEHHAVNYYGVGIEYESQWWVDPEQVQLPAAALRALSAQLPAGANLGMTAPDVDLFIERENRGQLLLKIGAALVVLAFLGVCLSLL